MPDVGLYACIGKESLNLQGILRELPIKRVKANLPAHVCLNGPVNRTLSALLDSGLNLIVP